MREKHCALGVARYTRRRGFALLAVLWVVLAASTLGTTITFIARESISAARNRTSATRAMWRAHDCLERARVAIEESLRETPAQSARPEAPWLALDSIVARSRLTANLPCRIELRAAGVSLDVNVADEEMLRRMFLAAGLPSPRADSLTDALLDWRDADEVTRPRGAERAWYAQSRRLVPRNGPFAADREIALVRGFDAAPVLDGLLTVESGRIVVSQAPLPVVAALPGFGEEALARLQERRARGARPVDLVALGSELSPEGRASLLAHYAELARVTTVEPEAWIATSRGRDAASPVTAVLETRLVRAGARAAIVRRRSWIE
jgi:general secretion pathway protein K